MARAAALLAVTSLLAGCSPDIHTWTAVATTPPPRSAPLPTPAPTLTPVPTPRRTPAATATPAPPPPATASPAPPAAEPSPATADPPGGVTAIGDSVMLGASSALRAAIPSIEVDAVVSRQWDPGVATVESDRGSGRLRPTLVVDLGTNGTVSAAQFDAMVRAATGTRRIVFVTVRVPRSWEASVNATLRAGVARHPGAVLADWYAASAGHPEWFGPDGYHLQPAGARALASLIAGAV
ncbi:MAG TPA: hypothetical protein VGP96_15925 [Candidatus Dormibacteraeota bacterium]|nr:hypothetical protein [Candidatus Dormibacteraeota bacterium]